MYRPSKFKVGFLNSIIFIAVALLTAPVAIAQSRSCDDLFLSQKTTVTEIHDLPLSPTQWTRWFTRFRNKKSQFNDSDFTRYKEIFLDRKANQIVTPAAEITSVEMWLAYMEAEVEGHELYTPFDFLALKNERREAFDTAIKRLKKILAHPNHLRIQTTQEDLVIETFASRFETQLPSFFALRKLDSFNTQFKVVAEKRLAQELALRGTRKFFAELGISKRLQQSADKSRYSAYLRYRQMVLSAFVRLPLYIMTGVRGRYSDPRLGTTATLFMNDNLIEKVVEDGTEVHFDEVHKSLRSTLYWDVGVQWLGRSMQIAGLAIFGYLFVTDYWPSFLNAYPQMDAPASPAMYKVIHEVAGTVSDFFPVMYGNAPSLDTQIADRINNYMSDCSKVNCTAQTAHDFYLKIYNDIPQMIGPGKSHLASLVQSSMAYSEERCDNCLPSDYLEIIGNNPHDMTNGTHELDRIAVAKLFKEIGAWRGP